MGQKKASHIGSFLPWIKGGRELLQILEPGEEGKSLEAGKDILGQDHFFLNKARGELMIATQNNFENENDINSKVKSDIILKNFKIINDPLFLE